MRRLVMLAILCGVFSSGVVESLSALPVAQAQYMQAAPSQPGGPIQKLKQKTTETGRR